MAAAAASMQRLAQPLSSRYKVFTAQLKEDDGKLTYPLMLEPEQKEAHEIRVHTDL